MRGNEKTVYTYDGQNRRLSKQNLSRKDPKGRWKPQPAVRYLYAGQNEIGSYDADGRCQELRLLGIGKGAEIGAAIAMEIDGKPYAPLHDDAGNVTGLIDAKDGRVVETYRYTAFGEHVLYDGNGSTIEKALSPWLFSSKRFDVETGCLCFGRRYYDPETSRWLTPDPIGLSGGPNLYAYTCNAPLNHIDLYGLYPVSTASWGDYVSWGFGMAQSLIRMPGTIVEFVGRHFVPIPFVRDVVQLAGCLLRDGDFNAYECSYGQRSFGSHLGLPELLESHRFVLTNGIDTSLKELRERAEKESALLGGYNVHYFYNATNGIALDLIECALQKLGWPNSCSTAFGKYMGEMTRSMMQQYDSPSITLAGHSQAGIFIEALQGQISANQCKLIDVFTFGAGTFVTKQTFNDATNFVSEYDAIPILAAPISRAWAQISPTPEIVFLKSNSFPLLDHFWDGDTYQEAFKDVILKTKQELLGIK